MINLNPQINRRTSLSSFSPKRIEEELVFKMTNSQEEDRLQTKLYDYQAVIEAEHSAIRMRRSLQGRKIEEDEQIPDIVGLSLSGGGIRSASFCMGALQALQSRDLIKEIDYLSTVSGGGYIGASMVAAMTRSHENAETDCQEAGEADISADRTFLSKNSYDFQDNENVQHIRDHSRYLMPHGIGDILKSMGILLRGLAVNIVLVLAFLLPVATIVILTNSTVEHLQHSFVADIVRYFFPLADKSWWFQFLLDRFLVTKITVSVGFAFLVVWGVRRSVQDANRDSSKPTKPDYQTGWAVFHKVMFVFAMLALITECQTYLIEHWINLFKSGVNWTNQLPALGTSIAAIVSTVVAFRQKLLGVIVNMTGTPTFGAALKVITAKSILFLSSMLVPMTIYAVFIGLTASGIAQMCRDPDCEARYIYPLLPG